MTQLTRMGIDVAKHVFQLHGVDERGHTVLRRRISRAQLRPFVAQLRPCLIGVEACGSAHYWARELTALGHPRRRIRFEANGAPADPTAEAGWPDDVDAGGLVTVTVDGTDPDLVADILESENDAMRKRMSAFIEGTSSVREASYCFDHRSTWRLRNPPTLP